MSYPIDMDDRAQEVHAWARRQGFYHREFITVRDPVLGDVEARVPNPSLPAEKLMLVVTEVSEAMEALRNDDRENEAEEIADAVIRLMDYAAWRGFNIDAAVRRKMGRNHERERLHGRKF